MIFKLKKFFLRFYITFSIIKKLQIKSSRLEEINVEKKKRNSRNNYSTLWKMVSLVLETRKIMSVTIMLNNFKVCGFSFPLIISQCQLW